MDAVPEASAFLPTGPAATFFYQTPSAQACHIMCHHPFTWNISTQSDRAMVHKCLYSRCCIQYHDEICELCAHLTSKAHSACHNRRRCRPIWYHFRVNYLLIVLIWQLTSIGQSRDQQSYEYMHTDKMFAVRYLAMTKPEPARPENKNPAFSTVKIAKPFASLRIWGGMMKSTPFPLSIILPRKCSDSLDDCIQ